jgi:hypothetical protein
MNILLVGGPDDGKEIAVKDLNGMPRIIARLIEESKTNTLRRIYYVRAENQGQTIYLFQGETKEKIKKPQSQRKPERGENGKMV